MHDLIAHDLIAALGLTCSAALLLTVIVVVMIASTPANHDSARQEETSQ